MLQAGAVDPECRRLCLFATLAKSFHVAVPQSPAVFKCQVLRCDGRDAGAKVSAGLRALGGSGGGTQPRGMAQHMSSRGVWRLCDLFPAFTET